MFRDKKGGGGDFLGSMNQGQYSLGHFFHQEKRTYQDVTFAEKNFCRVPKLMKSRKEFIFLFELDNNGRMLKQPGSISSDLHLSLI